MILAIINLVATIPVFVPDMLAFLPIIVLDVVMVNTVMVVLRVNYSTSEACGQYS
ncbi:MAG: hypothetical protein WB561_08500 [Terracidiphilus sp.]